MAPRLLFLFLVVTVSFAFGDWPQWRGRERTGVAFVPPPASWPESLSKVWQVPVGIGHSSPVVEGDRLLGFSNLRKGQLVAIDAKGGKSL